MASGRLGAEDLAAATETTLYTVPVDRKATVNVSFVNRGTVTAKIKLALSPALAGSAVNADFLEFERILDPKDSIERLGIVMDTGQILFVESDVIDVTAVAYGFEDII